MIDEYYVLMSWWKKKIKPKWLYIYLNYNQQDQP